MPGPYRVLGSSPRAWLTGFGLLFVFMIAFTAAMIVSPEFREAATQLLRRSEPGAAAFSGRTGRSPASSLRSVPSSSGRG